MNESGFLKNLDHLLDGYPPEAQVRLSRDDVKRLLAISKKYSTLHDIGKLVASEMELEPLLLLAMDKVIEVTGAQRGFIALVEEKSRPDFKVARNLEKSDIDKPQFQVSRSIIQEVLSTCKPVCLPAAIEDATFGLQDSVSRLRLLSVLCVPIKVKNDAVGLIYVDNPGLAGVFGEVVTELLSSFAEQIAIALQNAHLFSGLKRSHQQIASELRAKNQFDKIIGSSRRITEILQLIVDVADTEATVLILGESGTGKELVAEALHQNSSRRHKPLVTVNCGAIPEQLFESELFGHEKGAFTDAKNAKRGKFELADTGTIFLDEIGDLSLNLQVKLLRALQEKKFFPVGSEIEKHCNVRVIAATNRDLKTMLAENTFREDLYYRLTELTLTLPPLRERREDILLLIDHFLWKHKKGDKSPRLSKSVERFLLDYSYPGNIRQLESIVRGAVIRCKSEIIDVLHLPDDLKESLLVDGGNNDQPVTFQERKQRAIEEFEREELTRILTLTGGKLRESARVAGMHVPNFSEKLKRYDIKAEDYKK